MELVVAPVEPVEADFVEMLIGSGPTARPVPGPSHACTALFCMAGDFWRILVPLCRPAAT